jgi:hypothetical protein
MSEITIMEDGKDIYEFIYTVSRNRIFNMFNVIGRQKIVQTQIH